MAKFELNSSEKVMEFWAILTLNDGVDPTVDYGINFTVSRISEGHIQFIPTSPQKRLLGISLEIRESAFCPCLALTGPIATDGNGDVVSVDVFTSKEDVSGIQQLADLPGMRLHMKFAFERV